MVLRASHASMARVTRTINDNTYVGALPNSMNISNTFNVADIYEHQGDEALYKNEILGSSSLEMKKTNVGRLTARIKEEVARMKGSIGIVQV